MRDLQADLEICNKATPGPWRCLDDTPVDPEWANIFPQDLDFVMEAREGWPHAIERAIKAEAEVERLKPIEEFADKNFKLWENAAYTMNAKLRAENALLRKVVDAARGFISSITGCNPKECGKCDPNIGFCRWSGIGQALAELDKEES